MFGYKCDICGCYLIANGNGDCEDCAKASKTCRRIAMRLDEAVPDDEPMREMKKEDL